MTTTDLREAIDLQSQYLLYPPNAEFAAARDSVLAFLSAPLTCAGHSEWTDDCGPCELRHQARR